MYEITDKFTPNLTSPPGYGKYPWRVMKPNVTSFFIRWSDNLDKHLMQKEARRVYTAGKSFCRRNKLELKPHIEREDVGFRVWLITKEKEEKS